MLSSIKPMSPTEAITRLMNLEAKVYQLSSYTLAKEEQDNIMRIIQELKAIRESIFEGFPCSVSGVCIASQNQLTKE